MDSLYTRLYQGIGGRIYGRNTISLKVNTKIIYEDEYRINGICRVVIMRLEDKNPRRNIYIYKQVRLKV